MTIWPNWVDLVVVIAVLRTSYNGFGRGLLAELLSAAAAVCVTSLTVNYWSVTKGWLQGWISMHEVVAAPLVFWVLFLSLVVVTRLGIRRITDVLKWERLHWMVQGIGFVVGAFRGLWWMGFLLLMLSLSGVVYLQESVDKRSVIGPRLLSVWRPAFVQVADRFPGALLRDKNRLVPPVRPVQPTPP